MRKKRIEYCNLDAMTAHNGGTFSEKNKGMLVLKQSISYKGTKGDDSVAFVQGKVEASGRCTYLDLNVYRQYNLYQQRGK